MIDKHAAHERIIYEKLKAEKAADYRQILLAPVTVTLGKTEYDAAINNLDMFSDCGFEVEDFGNSTVIVSSPQYIRLLKLKIALPRCRATFLRVKTISLPKKWIGFTAMLLAVQL